ncbi:MAG: universal stress protein [Thainema sp.]
MIKHILVALDYGDTCQGVFNRVVELAQPLQANLNLLSVLIPERDSSLTQPLAKNWGADLIMMGSHGRKGLNEMLLGSASNYVVHHATCSVMVVHEPDEAMRKYKEN